jgi:hypothetical protein
VRTAIDRATRVTEADQGWLRRHRPTTRPGAAGQGKELDREGPPWHPPHACTRRRVPSNSKPDRYLRFFGIRAWQLPTQEANAGVEWKDIMPEKCAEKDYSVPS